MLWHLDILKHRTHTLTLDPRYGPNIWDEGTLFTINSFLCVRAADTSFPRNVNEQTSAHKWLSSAHTCIVKPWILNFWQKFLIWLMFLGESILVVKLGYSHRDFFDVCTLQRHLMFVEPISEATHLIRQSSIFFYTVNIILEEWDCQRNRSEQWTGQKQQEIRNVRVR